jgi:hypothetical protein
MILQIFGDYNTASCPRKHELSDTCTPPKGHETKPQQAGEEALAVVHTLRYNIHITFHENWASSSNA